MRRETPGEQVWRLLACLFGMVAGGCCLDGRPEQRYASFDISPSGDQVIPTVVSRVRQRVAEGVTFLTGHSINTALIYPQDRIVADLGIGAGPDLDDTAIIIALEKDLDISLPDEETERVFTVADLVHLCERRLELAPSSSNTDQT